MKYCCSLLIFMSLILGSCKDKPAEKDVTRDDRTTIEMVTDKGTMLIELYNETPKHRDNFIKLVKEGTLDSLMFHRVIQNFMVQSGDIESRYAKPNDTLGSGELDYRVSAEFHPDLFHKKGALGAARDGNLQRASSSTQFYIVQGVVQTDSLLDFNQGRINGWLQEHKFRNDPQYKALIDASNAALKNDMQEMYVTLQDSIVTLMRDYPYKKYTIPDAHRDVYKTIGGTPHLDQNYTVFGEVVKGLEVIDSIAAVETNTMDRPLQNVRIVSVKIRK